MSWLLKIAPWYWRWAAVAALAAALMAWGYLHGYLREEHKFDVYQAAVDAIGQEAAKRAAERKAAQDVTTKEVRDDFQSDVRGIRAYYDRRLRDAQATRSRGVSAAADGAGGADGAAGERAPCRADPDARVPLQPGGDAAAIEFERACALDAAKLVRWQDFARKNGLPIR